MASILKDPRMAMHGVLKAVNDDSMPKLRHGAIDMVHLDRQAQGDAGLQSELLRLFAGLARRDFGRLEQSTDVPELLVHLHFLRGAATSVGARHIERLAGTAADDLLSGGQVDPERIEDIGMAVEECCVFIEGYLASEQG